MLASQNQLINSNQGVQFPKHKISERLCIMTSFELASRE